MNNYLLEQLSDVAKMAWKRDHCFAINETCWFLSARLHSGEPDVFVDRGKVVDNSDYYHKVQSVLHSNGEIYTIAQHLVFKTPSQAREILIMMCKDAAKRDEDTNFHRPQLG